MATTGTQDVEKEIYILTPVPFSSSLRQAYGIEAFNSCGISPTVVDISGYYFGDLPRSTTGTVGSDVRGLTLKALNSKAECEAWARGLGRGSIVIFFESFNFRSVSHWRMLSKSSATLVLPIMNPIPLITNEGLKTAQTNSARHLLTLAIRGLRVAITKPKHLAYLFISKISPRVLMCRFADIALIRGGTAALNWDRQLIGKNTKTVVLPASDYDLYRRTSVPNIAADKIVFLDHGLVSAFDFSALKIPPPVDPETYLPAMRRIFDIWEDYFKLPVVIAGHPKANYSQTLKEFGERRIMIGQTAELVASSMFVATHFSTAANLAVLFNKPLVVLVSNDINRSYAKRACAALAKSLGLSPLNIDACDAQRAIPDLSIREHRYTEYVETYIKTQQTPDDAGWRTFIDVSRGLMPPPH